MPDAATPTMGQLLARLARSYRGRPAVIDERRTVTFGTLNERANRLANGLRAQGVGRSDRVILLSENRSEVLELYHACARLGAVMCPLNLRWAPVEIKEVVAHADARAAVIDPSLEGLWQAAAAKEAVGGRVLWLGAERRGESFEELIERGSSTLSQEYEVTASLPVVMLYTSGTTGLPKAAQLTQANNIWDGLAAIRHLPWRRSDVVFQAMPLFHCGGLHMLTSGALYQGLPVILQRRWDVSTAPRLIGRHACTMLFLQERMVEDLLQHVRPAHALESLRLIHTAAGRGMPEFVHRIRADLGADEVRYGYGLTEAGPLVSLTETNEDLLERPGNMGRPVFFSETRIISETGDPVEGDDAGELLVRGPNVFAGYFRRPEETSAALDDAGWLHTGDIIRADEDGSLFFVDRSKDMIKTGGENVYPAEVESKLLAANPELAEVVVVGIPSGRWGEEVVAMAVRKEGQRIEEDKLRQRARSLLAGFKVPKQVFFVGSLPRTDIGGKIRRSAVRDMAAALASPADEIGRSAHRCCSNVSKPHLGGSSC